MTNFNEWRSRLDTINQGHVLTGWASLSPERQKALLDQLAGIDLEELPTLVKAYVLSKPAAALPADLRPARYYPYDASGALRPWDRAAYKHAGEDLIRRGKVAAFVVAGGQGSRLGYEGPKGCYPAGAVTDAPLFEIFAQGILATRRKYSTSVPWYIMTSPLNHAQTVAFFEANGFFGLPRGDVMFLPQGVMPSLDIATGRMLMAAPGEIATNPDGHGGCVRALDRSGALRDMEKRGIEQLSYFQVDNPLVRVIDPVFIGLHAAAPDSSGEMSSKMLAKAGPDEKVGVFCEAGGKTRVIEYSDMPATIVNAKRDDGSLLYNAGSIAIHVISVEFLGRLARDPRFELPWHRAEKKVACVDPATGKPLNPTVNNAVKLERFVFDALELCRASIVLETDRVEEFAPIKNATGVDSAQSCREIQTQRAARWLAAAGVEIPRTPDGKPDCVLEIRPGTALCAQDLQSDEIPRRIGRGEKRVF